ncbi:hypothetical protein TIFTF001_051802 [Ficus carica]|uniref:Uncharacterized protein n=1 Tax=Ficus carica TaxID=3494 RepID=A0AA88JEJ7_FICCA|nr:hypothetical protein TIFTF001_051802 [Ficus carica]
MNKYKGGRFGRTGRDSKKQFCIGISLREQSVLKCCRNAAAFLKKSGELSVLKCCRNAAAFLKKKSAGMLQHF